jgi:hypothetical protein
MNQKQQIRKELNEYLDNYIPRTETDIYKHVVDFIKKDRARQLILSDVSQQRELLKAFCEWAFKEDSDWHQVNSHIEGYLDSL